MQNVKPHLILNQTKDLSIVDNRFGWNKFSNDGFRWFSFYLTRGRAQLENAVVTVHFELKMETSNIM